MNFSNPFRRKKEEPSEMTEKLVGNTSENKLSTLDKLKQKAEHTKNVAAERAQNAKKTTWETKSWLGKVTTTIKCNTNALVGFTIVVIIFVTIAKEFGHSLLSHPTLWDILVVTGIRILAMILAVFAYLMFKGSYTITGVEAVVTAMLIYSSRITLYNLKGNDAIKDAVVITIMAYSFTVIDAIFRKKYLDSQGCGNVIPLNVFRKNLNKDKVKETTVETNVKTTVETTKKADVESTKKS